MEYSSKKVIKPALNLSSSGLVTAHNDKKKQKIIKWDEETIAEHDKERGSRYSK
jgi:hypothetical protein